MKLLGRKQVELLIMLVLQASVAVTGCVADRKTVTRLCCCVLAAFHWHAR